MEFEKAAAGLNIPVGRTADADLIQQYSPSKVVMIQKFDDKLAKFTGAMNAAEISDFASANALPLVVQFSQETQDKIFGEDAPKRHILALHSEGYTDKANLDRELAAVAKEYRGKFLVISVEKVQDNEGVFNFFGVSDVSKPTIISIDQSKSGMKKFFYDGEQEHTAMKAWAADVLSGKLNPVLKSEDPPTDNSGSVKVCSQTKHHRYTFSLCLLVSVVLLLLVLLCLIDVRSRLVSGCGWQDIQGTRLRVGQGRHGRVLRPVVRPLQGPRARV